MADENIRDVWQSQRSETSFTEIRTRVEQMEKRERRHLYDGYIAVTLIAVVIVGIAVLYANALLIAGASVTVCGFLFLVTEVADHRRHRPVAADGNATSLEYVRALLQHRLAFCRRRLWLRVLFLAPGGALFFLGFAAARPDLAPIIYVELFTFAVGIALIVPLNRRAAAKLERQIAQLDN